MEHGKALLAYGTVTAVLAVAMTAMMAVTSVVDIGGLIHDNCHEVLTLLKESWLDAWVGVSRRGSVGEGVGVSNEWSGHVRACE